MRISAFFLLVFLLVFFASAGIGAQVLPPPDPVMPEEYDPEEFPLWTQDLRRFEVVTVGSFPITFFATSLVYDFSIYASKDFNPAYGMGSQRGNDDIAIIMGTAAAASVLVATVDLIINISRRKKAEEGQAPDEP